LRGFWKLTWVQAKLFAREPAAFFFTLVFPTLLLLVFGAIFGNEPGGFGGPKFGYIDTEVPGLLAIIIAQIAFMGIPIAVAMDREKRILRRYRATPLSPVAYLASHVVSLAPTARVAQTVGMVAFFPMMFLSGAALPRAIMPLGVRHVSDALPLTTVVRLLQGLWYGEPWRGHLVQVGVLAGLLAVGTAISSRAFRWDVS
jgi:ABC-2 type transport system permease protein